MRSARFQSVTAGARVGRRRHATGALEAAAGRRRRDYGKGPGLHGREEVGGRADAGRAETSGQGQSQGWEIDGSEEGYRQDGAGAAEQMQQQRIVEDEEVLAVSPAPLDPANGSFQSRSHLDRVSVCEGSLLFMCPGSVEEVLALMFCAEVSHGHCLICVCLFFPFGQEELRDLQASSFQLEARMLEISKLNHIFSVNVLQQAEQIEHLYNEVRTSSAHSPTITRKLCLRPCPASSPQCLPESLPWCFCACTCEGLFPSFLGAGQMLVTLRLLFSVFLCLRRWLPPRTSTLVTGSLKRPSSWEAIIASSSCSSSLYFPWLFYSTTGTIEGKGSYGRRGISWTVPFVDYRIQGIQVHLSHSCLMLICRHSKKSTPCTLLVEAGDIRPPLTRPTHSSPFFCFPHVIISLLLVL